MHKTNVIGVNVEGIMNKYWRAGVEYRKLKLEYENETFIKSVSIVCFEYLNLVLIVYSTNV